jgi:hypothetical protein
MSEEPVLSDAERNDILRQLVERKKPTTEATVDSNKPSSTDGSLQTFGSLLEQSMINRAKFEEVDDKEVDDLRSKVLSESRLDLIGDLLK